MTADQLKDLIDALKPADPTAVPPPPTPKMGGVVPVNSKDIAWTGGKPKHDWSGLAEIIPDATKRSGYKAPDNYDSPGQVRILDPTNALKAYNTRKKPSFLEARIDSKVDLRMFFDALGTHLVSNGLDTIAYLNDPSDNTIMVNTLESYNKFSEDSARTAGDALVALFDDYDRTNNRCAKELLELCLDKTLLEKLKLRVQPNDFFGVHIVILAQIIQVGASTRNDYLEEQIKKISASQYPGNDIEAMCLDITRHVKDLNNS